MVPCGKHCISRISRISTVNISQIRTKIPGSNEGGRMNTELAGEKDRKTRTVATDPSEYNNEPSFGQCTSKNVVRLKAVVLIRPNWSIDFSFSSCLRRKYHKLNGHQNQSLNERKSFHHQAKLNQLKYWVTAGTILSRNRKSCAPPFFFTEFNELNTFKGVFGYSVYVTPRRGYTISIKRKNTTV